MAPNALALFPHLTSTGPPPTSLTVVDVYRTVFQQRVAEGTLRPMVIPYHLYGMIFLVAYLYIPHKNSPVIYAARWPVLAIICWWQWKTLWETSSMSMATAFVAGLTAAWGVWWALIWLVFRRPQWDAKRVQRRTVQGREEGTERTDKESTGHTSGVEKASDTTGTRERRRIEVQGDAKTLDTAAGTQYHEYYWQPYPSALWPRFLWLADLLINFRGPGWNWQLAPLPTLPPVILYALNEPVTHRALTPHPPNGLRRFDTRAALIRYQLPRFIIGYILLDAIKTFMIQDPYFIFGPTTYALPPPIADWSPATLRLMRGAVSGLAIISALETVFLLSPLFFCVICGPRLLGVYGESWMYPTTWGSFSHILDHGLAGLWGGWWHQTFRLVFSAPTNHLIEKGYLKSRSTATKIISLLFAFGISGMLHSAGSISQFPPTHPTAAPIFFLLQALGIALQTGLGALLHTPINALPACVRRAGNALFALTWMLTTCSWLTDDFARGGVWLLEPVPVSLFRGLGYGEEGTGWWCWGWLGIGWYGGERWWESGIAL